MGIIGGEAKIGKTFNIFSGYASALALGENLYTNQDWYIPEPVRVLVVEQELGEYILQKRIKKIFDNTNLAAYANNLWAISKEPDIKIDTNIDLLRKQIDLIQPQILILDPIAKFHGGNENDAQDIEKLINSLSKLIREYKHNDLAILFTHHYGKPPSAAYADQVDRLDPYQFRGSSKWFDAADFLHTIIKTKKFEKEDDYGEKWQGWSMKNRFTLRAGENPPDFHTTFNEFNDQRVKFDKYDGLFGKKPLSLNKLIVKPRTVIDPVEQNLFNKLS